MEDDQLPHKVATLPFVNGTSNPEAATIVRKMFSNFFSSLNYQDLETALIDSELKRKNLYRRIIGGENLSPQRLGQVRPNWQTPKLLNIKSTNKIFLARFA